MIFVLIIFSSGALGTASENQYGRRKKHSDYFRQVRCSIFDFDLFPSEHLDPPLEPKRKVGLLKNLGLLFLPWYDPNRQLGCSSLAAAWWWRQLGGVGSAATAAVAVWRRWRRRQQGGGGFSDVAVAAGGVGGGWQRWRQLAGGGAAAAAWRRRWGGGCLDAAEAERWCR